MTTAERVRVVAAVAWRQGRVLLCRRPAHKHHGGLWEFPGGKVEAGETPAQAMVREVEEELAVPVVHVGAPLWTRDDPGRPLTLVFLPVEFHGEPACVEHSAHAWSTPREALAMDLAPLDRAFLETVLLPMAEATAH